MVHRRTSLLELAAVLCLGAGLSVGAPDSVRHAGAVVRDALKPRRLPQHAYAPLVERARHSGGAVVVVADAPTLSNWLRFALYDQPVTYRTPRAVRTKAWLPEGQAPRWVFVDQGPLGSQVPTEVEKWKRLVLRGLSPDLALGPVERVGPWLALEVVPRGG